MRALVTGGSGFVGRVLCRQLRESGAIVRVAIHRQKPDLAGLEFVNVGSLGPNTDWAPALDGVDHVYHLAGLAHDRFPESQLVETNVDGTARLAESAEAAGVSRFLFLSSIKVCGNVSTRPFRAVDPVCPADAYARTKARAEEVVRSRGRRWTIVRSPLVYGAGVRGNFRKLMDAVERERIIPVGAASGRRDFIFVENLANALVFLAGMPEAEGRIVHVRDGKSLEVREMIARIGDAMGRRARTPAVSPVVLRMVLRFLGHGAAASRLLESLEVDDEEIRAMGWTAPWSGEDGIRMAVEEERGGRQ